MALPQSRRALASAVASPWIRPVKPSPSPAEPLEVEVERLPEHEHERRADRDEPPHAGLRGALGPILGGIALDLLDFATLGPMGAKLGLPLGFLCGWWWGGQLGLRRRQRLTLALVAGVYCMLPGTRILPLGTLFGTLRRFSGLFAG